MSYMRAIGADDLWDGEMRAVVVDGKDVLLLKMGGRVHAYEDRCAHQAARLSEGRFDGRTIVCPRHEWRFDACTGCGVNPVSARLIAFPVRIEGGDVLVDVAPTPASTRTTVGPVLQTGGRAAAVIAAICEENAEAEITDRGAYVRVSVPERCRVSRQAIERHTGTPFELPRDLEAIMTSFKGQLKLSDDEAVWFSARSDGR